MNNNDWIYKAPNGQFMNDALGGERQQKEIKLLKDYKTHFF